MDKPSIKALMCEIPHFDRLDDDELDIMAEYIDYQKVEAGNTLVKEGDMGESLYYIISGEMEIQKEALDGRQAVLARFKKGATVGEMAIIEQKSPRSATAVTLKETELLVLTRSRFDELSDSNPGIALKITQNIANMISARLRHTSGRFADVYQ
ncbi:MAG: cyclic nucleotide-binding domain-containing protein [Nitrospinota bacterium]